MPSQRQPPISRPPETPCNGCEFQVGCTAHVALNQSLYSNPSFTRENLSIPGVTAATSARTIALIRGLIRDWRVTATGAGISADVSLPALFDVVMSGLYAQQLNVGSHRDQLDVVVHPLPNGGRAEILPYLWMCPLCIGEGVPASEAYLPDGERRGTRVYARQTRLSRPGGRRIGDLGAVVVRLIIESLTVGSPHLTAGGGHRGEFDLVMSSSEQLVLGEIKASPLVAFPIVKTDAAPADGHTWQRGVGRGGNWWMYVGAADLESSWLMLDEPSASSDLWPLDALANAAQSSLLVEDLTKAWGRHLTGYRLFNAEPASTRWHRFGCGNIETVRDGERLQLRVDNTKSLPGIDRTDDIKKGVAQVMLFDRLKKGCQRDAVKTVLFGNLFAETHHEHYLRPLASLRLEWPGQTPVWLFDAIIALSRNIVNDEAVGRLLPVENSPYSSDEVDATALIAGLGDEDGDD